MTELVKLPHFVSVENLSTDQITSLIERAEYFKKGGATPELTKPVYVTNMFFENSTRTHTSFAMAEKKLGLTEIPFDSAHSSMSKGETLYDTCLVMNALGVDLTVIRAKENNYYNALINPGEGQHLELGIVNGGDGSGQHPSQCMLDIMTIHEKFGHFDGLKVAIVGDITNSRVARSNMEILTRLGAEVYFSGPEYWYDHEFDKFGKYLPFDELVEEVDVMMLLRVQHERHDGDANEATFDAADYHKKYGINHDVYQRLKKDCIIMHPGPINHDVELAGDLVEAPKSMFFKQMQNGVFMRMAMLEAVLRGRKLGGLE
ncbi:MAG: aspartate carbamoyltransferase catalytic subunit [Limosilactobacillus sp.]|uniref:aspartate carbamoyltransferase catalytic subunit n=1 Tax=Limosilactobacillus sp. TaxID=2773925 RepID=UPI0027092740|nr:aspartate carbamoyltransferase catalytic subunit [Limosilactobacillus sp.]